MDNIDWVKIKERETGADEDQDSSDDDEPAPVDEIANYKEMIKYMKPGESVSKTIRRLGGGKSAISSSSASQRWKTKRQKTTDSRDTASAEDKANMLKMTELADLLLQGGNFEVYQDTYEKIQFKINMAEEKSQAGKTVIPEDVDDDDALDMFASDIDKREAKKEETEAGESSAPESSAAEGQPGTSSGTTNGDKSEAGKCGGTVKAKGSKALYRYKDSPFRYGIPIIKIRWTWPLGSWGPRSKGPAPWKSNGAFVKFCLRAQRTPQNWRIGNVFQWRHPSNFACGPWKFKWWGPLTLDNKCLLRALWPSYLHY